MSGTVLLQQLFYFFYVTDSPNSTVHAVIAAQSFHWFANDKSISEIHRVLVPGGWVLEYTLAAGTG